MLYAHRIAFHQTTTGHLQISVKPMHINRAGNSFGEVGESFFELRENNKWAARARGCDDDDGGEICETKIAPGSHVEAASYSISRERAPACSA
eukprot:scaffold559749_cov17-Prasinocladus_malaysianus.AAC.1